MACHCRYWHFEGDKNAWLARCAFEPEQNRAELEASAGSPELEGVVALDHDGRIVGWMKIIHVARIRKLYDQRAYRTLPCFGGDRSAVYGIGCFLVDEEQRRKGVARGLLSAGIEAARAAGGKVVEAFPRRADQVSDDQLFTGPFPIFEQQGFRVINDFAPYPVLRLEL